MFAEDLHLHLLLVLEVEVLLDLLSKGKRTQSTNLRESQSIVTVLITNYMSRLDIA